jgi:hypothetical protein
VSAELDTATAAACALETQARALVVTTADEYARAAEFLLGVKELRAQIAATFDPHIKRAYDAHRALCAEKRQAEAAAVTAERLAKEHLIAWDLAQTRRAEIEGARLQTIAEDVAADETLSDALAAAEAGDLVLAEQILDAPILVPTAAVRPDVPPVNGIARRDTWSAEIIDFAALVAAAAANPMWLALLKPDTKALDAQARSLRHRLAIPGVRVVKTPGIAASRGSR